VKFISFLEKNTNLAMEERKNSSGNYDLQMR
jgi:hypothetical protein